ncbi:MAG: cytochrome c nitrite reductase small subunit [Blastocatellia bacterium]|nr:cytochrome c nitrite reductase small subunit [Blastocatellia bacterium]
MNKTKTVALSVAVGIVGGVGLYTFLYAKGTAYLFNDPQACANCHVMRDQYDGWLKSSHRSAATCNDCHTPQGFVGKYANKASNGFWHSFAFTTGRFHEPIQIKKHNREITENACRKCHAEITSSIEANHKAGDEISCLQCHRNVGHMH